MFNEKHNNFPLQLFVGEYNWYLNFMYIVKNAIFNKIYCWFENFSLFKRFFLIIKIKKIIKYKNFFNFYYKKKIKKIFLL